MKFLAKKTITYLFAAERLTGSGWTPRSPASAEGQGRGEYLHRRIAARPFERRFQLTDFVEVSSANFENGLLTVALRRVFSETMKPRRIEIAAVRLLPSSSMRQPRQSHMRRVRSSGVQLRQINFRTPCHLMEDD